MDSASLNQKLIERFQEVCEHLLPQGKVVGSHYAVGGLDGSPGESLQITLTGTAAGRYIDFAHPEDKGGTPLYLWAQARHITFREAVEEARKWLGLPESDYGGVRRHKNKEWASPTTAERSGVRLAECHSKVMDYLVVERRLDPIVIAQARIGESPDGEWAIFPYLNPGEKEAFHLKKLKLERVNGKKVMTASTGTRRGLYGKHLIEDDASELIITEGEIDTLSFHSWKLPANSVPNGVSDFLWIEIEWEWLERFERIHIAMDMDDPGREAANQICSRLGVHRCDIVSLPHKDANECLMAGVSRDEIIRCLASAKPVELAEIKHPGDFKSEVIALHRTDWTKFGWDTPWYPALPWRVRKSEFTILTGFSGHGKALSLDTPLPTPSGWTTMGEVKVGDQVFDEMGKPCNVTFATGIQMDRKCYRVEFSDGTSVIADADHLWETWSPHARNSAARILKQGERPMKAHGSLQKRVGPSVVRTAEIAETVQESRWADNKHLRHGVRVAKPLECPWADLPIEPYCLGVWLGDGDSECARFTCSQWDGDILENLATCGFPAIPNKVLGDKTPRYRIDGLGPLLKKENLLGNKHIPKSYLRADAVQRMLLLQGLMDTDGTCTTYGRCEFTTMRESLASGVFELVASLGMRPTQITGEAKVNGKCCGTKYRICFTPSQSVFRLRRKAARIRTNIPTSRRDYRYIVAVVPVESVPVKCIQVDSPRSLYLCGKGMIPTHNTPALNQLMLHLLSQGCKVMNASLEVKPAMTLYDMTKCALAKGDLADAEVEACITWLNDSMFFLDCIGTVSTKQLLHAFDYAKKRHGIDIFVIDSLFKVGISSEDYGGQREFADKLTTFCNNTGAHVILVAHTRKTQNGNETLVPSKSDVAGSSDLVNAAFNVIVWWRNKMKNRKLAELRQQAVPDLGALASWMEAPDNRVVLDKQKFGGGLEAEIKMWFSGDSNQFHPVAGRKNPYFVLKSGEA